MYVAHHVQDIQAIVPSKQCCYVNTRDNPTDIASRGCSPQQLLSSTLWWSSPSWLLQSLENWPATSLQAHSNMPEARVFITLSTDSQPTFSSWWQFQGDYTSLLHLTAWIRCFRRHCHQPFQRCTPHRLLQPDEIEDARLYLLLLAPRELFPDELRQLRKGEAVANKSKLLCLSPMVVKDDILRVGGRLSLSNLPSLTQHPIILHARHPLVERLIRHTHNSSDHPGPSVLLSILNHHYYIIQGKCL